MQAAVIGIGSNSVRSLVARNNGGVLNACTAAGKARAFSRGWTAAAC